MCAHECKHVCECVEGQEYKACLEGGQGTHIAPRKPTTCRKILGWHKSPARS